MLPGLTNLDQEAAEKGAKLRNEITQQRSPITQPLPELQVNQKVLLQDPVNKTWGEKTATIVAIRNEGRTFDLMLDGSGRITTRNRIHIRPMHNLENEHDLQIPDSSNSAHSSDEFPDVEGQVPDSAQSMQATKKQVSFGHVEVKDYTVSCKMKNYPYASNKPTRKRTSSPYNLRT